MYHHPQAYDPAAYPIQACDPSAASYYAYPYPQYGGDVHQQYPCYNVNVQTQQRREVLEPGPPGVSYPSQQMHAYYSQYYQHSGVLNLDPRPGGVNAGVTGVLPAQQSIIHSSYGGTDGIHGRVPFEGARGHSGQSLSVMHHSSHGRGRGRGHTRQPPKHISAPAQSQIRAEPVTTPPKVAWCELCKVNCNTLEILEVHNRGKKHMKNLKVHGGLLNHNKMSVGGQIEQTSASELKTVVPAQPDQIQGYEGKLTVENLQVEAEAEKRKIEEVEPTVDSAKRPRMDHPPGRGRGLKQKARGGKDNKRTRSTSGPRMPVEPRKPKEVIPLICELCNIKCDTAAVFQCHLVGKKHLSKAKSFLSQNKVLGQEVLKALSPAIQALLQNAAANASTSSAPQLHHQALPPLQGISAQNANTATLYFPAHGITGETVELEAMNRPLSFSANSGAGYFPSMGRNVNDPPSESSAEDANPPPVSFSLAAVQAEHVSTYATSGTKLDVGFITEQHAMVPPSDEIPRTEPVHNWT